MAIHPVRGAQLPTTPAVDLTEVTRYPAFYDQVAVRQLADWLPVEPQRVLDVSRRSGLFSTLLRSGGHQFRTLLTRQEQWRPGSSEQQGLLPLDGLDPQFLRDGVDAVLAEGRTLSYCLAAELALDQLAAVLHPGGRLLCCVDSLVMGLARLAQQGRWAELADAPNADVVLVPDAAGEITRAFWPEELAGLLDDAGFDVEWIRPRTVLSPEAVERALASGGSSMEALVETEVTLAAERAGESIGMHLLASAIRR